MMHAVTAALALLSGVIGAGFASGREIMRFFAVHGPMALAAAACAILSLSFFFLRLSAQLQHAGCSSLTALCRVRFGPHLGAMCRALFLLLCAVTGGAMLSACAELGALMFSFRRAYALTMAATLFLGAACARRGMGGLALPGAVLCCLLPILLVRLSVFNGEQTCFLPFMTPELPIRAATDGLIYGALNAAMLAGTLEMLLNLDRCAQKRAVALFSLLFGALLCLGVLVCRRHMSEIHMQPMPFVWLSRSLGKSGYLLVCVCMYAAAFSTLCAMLCSLMRLLPMKKACLLLSALLCLFFARMGFSPLVSSGYPVLGALCAGLLLLLCLPGCPRQ